MVRGKCIKENQKKSNDEEGSFKKMPKDLQSLIWDLTEAQLLKIGGDLAGAVPLSTSRGAMERAEFVSEAATRTWTASAFGASSPA